MTTKEKLDKAIEFIKSIEKLNRDSYDHFDLDDLEYEAYCDDCGSNVEISWPTHVKLDTKYIDAKVLDDLSDKAWHLLFDLED